MEDSGKNSGAFQAYDTGLAFAHAVEVLLCQYDKGMHMLNYKDVMLSIPIIVNVAFACELFLKSLLAEPSRTHLLKELFLELGKQDNCLYDKVMQQSIFELKKIYDGYNEDKFWNDLGHINKAFEELRYMHEPKNIPEQRYNLDFLCRFCFVLRKNCEDKYGPRPLIIDPNR